MPVEAAFADTEIARDDFDADGVETIGAEAREPRVNPAFRLERRLGSLLWSGHVVNCPVSAD